MSYRNDEPPMFARVPADVEKPDKIAFGLTARQLAIAAGVAASLWALYTATAAMVPLPVFLAVALPVVAVTAALILGLRDGLTLDRLVLHAVRHLRAPRRLVPTFDDEPIVGAPSWVAAEAGPIPAPLRLPSEAVDETGVIDLGGDGVALICAATTVNFGLRTPAEQNALVAVFARWLNGLAAPVQIVVRVDRLDITALIADIETQAPGLPHPALEDAAREHARFLAELGSSRDLLCRSVFLVLREPAAPNRDAAARILSRRAEEAARALGAAEITLTPLDGTAALDVLRGACDPYRS